MVARKATGAAKKTNSEVLSPDEALALRLKDSFPDVRASDPEAVADRMAGRLHKATSMDELFDALEGSSSDQWIGKPIEVLSIEWETYDAVRPSGTVTIPKAVCQIVDITTGEIDEFMTTAKMLVHFLRQVEVLDAYPFKARIVEKTTKGGQKALNFERL
jgi:hypothetical protein